MLMPNLTFYLASILRNIWPQPRNKVELSPLGLSSMLQLYELFIPDLGRSHGSIAS